MEASNYVSNETVIEALKPLLRDKQITIVWGDWCGDSLLHVPDFYKILSEAGFPEKEITLIDVDRDKKAITGSIDDLNIVSVPTFIIFDGDSELGRIVESPVETLEEDLLALLTKSS